jgi:hypothetical protein
MSETKLTIYDLFNAGWTAHVASLYDEEGVEGWRWEDAEGNERAVELGPWHETPPMPDIAEDELRRMITGDANVQR